jgi:hypothetical protein
MYPSIKPLASGIEEEVKEERNTHEIVVLERAFAQSS